MKRIVVIDTRLWAYMCFHKRQPLTEMLPMLYQLLKDYPSNKVVFTFDVFGGSKRRKKLYANYKGQRKVTQDKQTPAEKQRLKDFNTSYYAMADYLRIFGSVIDIQGWESDDSVNIIVDKFLNTDWEVLLVSKDIDFCMNLKADNIKLIKDEQGTVITNKNMLAHTGFADYQELIDYQIHAGIAKESVTGVSMLGKGRFLTANRSEAGLIPTLTEWLEPRPKTGKGKYGMCLPEDVKTLDELISRNTEILRPILISDMIPEEQDELIEKFNREKRLTNEDDRMIEEMSIMGNPMFLSDDMKNYFKVLGE